MIFMRISISRTKLGVCAAIVFFLVAFGWQLSVFALEEESQQTVPEAAAQEDELQSQPQETEQGLQTEEGAQGQTEQETVTQGALNQNETDLSSGDEEDTTQSAIQTPASWELSYDANGGRGQIPENLTCTAGQQISLEDGEGMTRSDYFFLGWALSQDAKEPLWQKGEILSADKLAQAAEKEGQDTQEGIVLYAVWMEIQSHTVTYIDGDSQTTETVSTGEYPSQVPAAGEKQEDPQKQPQEDQEAEDEEAPDQDEETETRGPFLGWEDEEGNLVDPAAVQIFEDRVFTASYGVVLNSQDHMAYMNGSSDGTFQPDSPLSRAEAAQMLYSLIEEKEEPTVSFTDVASDMWYAPAINTMASMNLLSGYGDTFAPEREITRAEFVTLLSRFYPMEESSRNFTDVPADHWALGAIRSAAEKGWTSGYPDGTFRPDQSISRAETAVMMNRVLERSADKNTVENSGNTRIFIDLQPDHWAYYEIMEASCPHDYVKKQGQAETWTNVESVSAALAPGFYNTNGNLYLVKDNGQFARNETVGAFSFDRYGRYTTGDAQLDQYIVSIIGSVTTPEMTQEQKLRALYNYVRDNYSYLKRPLISAGQTGWENGYALEMLQLGKGNCYSFAATFYHLSKALGYDNNTVVGVVGTRRSPHGWVEIRMNGGLYMFDTELEMAYRAKGDYRFNLYKMTYGNTPFIYIKS